MVDSQSNSINNTINQLVMDDQIKGLQEYLRCGICFQILTEDRKPVECD